MAFLICPAMRQIWAFRYCEPGQPSSTSEAGSVILKAMHEPALAIPDCDKLADEISALPLD